MTTAVGDSGSSTGAIAAVARLREKAFLGCGEVAVPIDRRAAALGDVALDHGLTGSCGDETAQAVGDEERPGVEAHVKALVRRNQAEMAELELGATGGLGDLEDDASVPPLLLVVDEAHPVVDDVPD